LNSRRIARPGVPTRPAAQRVSTEIPGAIRSWPGLGLLADAIAAEAVP
jgi:hypothetical protein